MGGNGEGGSISFSPLLSDRIRVKNTQLHQGMFKLDSRKNFTVRAVRHWNRIPREVVDVPNLSVFKRHLDDALNSML